MKSQIVMAISVNFLHTGLTILEFESSVKLWEYFISEYSFVSFVRFIEACRRNICQARGAEQAHCQLHKLSDFSSL